MADPELPIARCDQCRFWRLESDNQEWEARWAGMGECTDVRERWRIMDEASAAIERGAAEDEWNNWDDSPPPPNSFTGIRVAALAKAKAYVQDGSEYRAELYTAPDFACVLFERKDADAHS